MRLATTIVGQTLLLHLVGATNYIPMHQRYTWDPLINDFNYLGLLAKRDECEQVADESVNATCGAATLCCTQPGQAFPSCEQYLGRGWCCGGGGDADLCYVDQPSVCEEIASVRCTNLAENVSQACCPRLSTCDSEHEASLEHVRCNMVRIDLRHVSGAKNGESENSVFKAQKVDELDSDTSEDSSGDAQDDTPDDDSKDDVAKNDAPDNDTTKDDATDNDTTKDDAPDTDTTKDETPDSDNAEGSPDGKNDTPDNNVSKDDKDNDEPHDEPEEDTNKAPEEDKPDDTDDTPEKTSENSQEPNTPELETPDLTIPSLEPDQDTLDTQETDLPELEHPEIPLHEKTSLKGLGHGAIVGIPISGIVAVALIAGLIYWCIRRRHRAKSQRGDSESQQDAESQSAGSGSPMSEVSRRESVIKLGGPPSPVYHVRGKFGGAGVYHGHRRSGSW